MAASATIPFVSIEDYLRSDPQPDMDYVDGMMEERNLGEYDHGDLQGELTTLFRNHRSQWQVRTVPETRLQVAPSRFRVPDVCVLPLLLGEDSYHSRSSITLPRSQVPRVLSEARTQPRPGLPAHGRS